MVLLVPRATWRETYEATAQGVVDGAHDEPVFDGAYGVEKTIALDVSVAMFESTFNPNAVGDHGAAKGLYQVHGAMPENARQATVEANRMMRQSFKACRSRPLEERLAWYASGGATGCENPGGQKASRHRVGLALRLFSKWLREGSLNARLLASPRAACCLGAQAPCGARCRAGATPRHRVRECSRRCPRGRSGHVACGTASKPSARTRRSSRSRQVLLCSNGVRCPDVGARSFLGPRRSLFASVHE